MAAEVKRVMLEKLKVTFDVRVRISEDRVLLFMELYEGGITLPPIDISGDNEVIDGRHRLEALRRLKRSWAPCVVTKETSRKKLLAMAVEANLGGPMPPTREDIICTMERCFDESMSRPEIIAIFPLPAEAVRRYLDMAYNNILQRRKAKALTAIATGNITVNEAAKKYDVPLRNLRTAVRRDVKQRETTPTARFKSRLNDKWKGVPVTVAQLGRHIIAQCESGEITKRMGESMMAELMSRVEKLRTVINLNRAKLAKIKS